MAFNYPWTNVHELNLSWIINQVKAMATKFKNVTASAETLEPTEEATVTVTESSTGFSFAFGIPRGASGSGNVTSVNGKTGVVVLDADDVGALPDDTDIPTKTSDLTNDSGFITDDALDDYRTSAAQDVIDATKQATLVSGTNIKTINNNSILGSGNIEISGTGAVTSVNGQTGTVVLDADDVGALPDTTTTLPNPYSLTFSGAVSGTYNGSSAVSITIPSGTAIGVAEVNGTAYQYISEGTQVTSSIVLKNLISGLTENSKIWIASTYSGVNTGYVVFGSLRLRWIDDTVGWQLTYSLINVGTSAASGTPVFTLYYIA